MYSFTHNSINPGISKYISGHDALLNLWEYSHILGERTFIIGGSTALGITRNKIEKSIQKSEIKYKFDIFEGFCSMTEIIALSDKAKKFDAEFVIAIGGGKAIDAAKTVALFNNIPYITVPTILSTCAAWTPVSVIYSNKGVPINAIETSAPDYVFCDYDILCQSPKRFFAAGLADSLAKFSELGMSSYPETNALYQGGIQLSQFIQDSCLDLGECLNKMNSWDYIIKNIDKISDIVIPLTGIVSELTNMAMTSGNLIALGHGIDEALLEISLQSHEFLHGERVFFGIIPHLIIHDASTDLIDKTLKFGLNLRLPLKFDNFNINNNNLNQLAYRAASSLGIKGSKISASEIKKALVKFQEYLGQAKEDYFQENNNHREGGDFIENYF